MLSDDVVMASLVVRVRRLECAAEWYRETFGATVEVSADGRHPIATMTLGGTVISLWQLMEGERPPCGSVSDPYIVVVVQRDIDEVRDELIRRGVDVTPLSEKSHLTRFFRMRDPRRQRLGDRTTPLRGRAHANGPYSPQRMAGDTGRGPGRLLRPNLLLMGRIRTNPLEGGRRYYELLGIFFRHDPVGINFESNVDEYAPEVETVLPRLDEASDVDTLASLLHEEFEHWFSSSAGPRDRYLPIAQEVWQWWQRDQPHDPEYERVLGDWLSLIESPPWPGDELYWASQVVVAYLAGLEPLSEEWAQEAVQDLESHAETGTSDQSEPTGRLLNLIERIRTFSRG